MFRLAFLRAATVFAFGIAVSFAADRALADIYIAVNKGAQRMTVMVDGKHRYDWAVSTGLNGGPPTGTFKPQRLEKMWHSRTYDMAPMPNSIFFYHGFAIHGTSHVGRLGRRASHGCVRLAPGNAATLYALVKERGMRSATIVISDSAPRYAKR